MLSNHFTEYIYIYIYIYNFRWRGISLWWSCKKCHPTILRNINIFKWMIQMKFSRKNVTHSVTNKQVSCISSVAKVIIDGPKNNYQ